MTKEVNTTVEYRVVPINRYIVTRYELSTSERGDSGGSDERGVYSNPDIAWEVAYALCKAEHERLGYPVDDPRIIYPTHPHRKVTAAQSASSL